jgi:DNA-binding LacI/PurR family transcriptional regulator
MTVSNAFSRPDQLSADLREKILAVAEELGYVGPDPAARALARGTTGAVGVLLTDALHLAFADDVATQFLGAFVEGMGPTGLALTLLTADDQGGEIVPARDVAMDGALVYSCRDESDARGWLERRKLPMVYVDQHPVDDVTCINVDDHGGAAASARHLVELGHRRIGIVTSALGEPAGVGMPEHLAQEDHPQRERLRGWNDALGEAGIEPAVVHVPRNLTTEGEQGAALLLGGDGEGESGPPTAILCYSDVLAIGVIQAARARGLSVPEDLSVVGFDDSAVAWLNDIGLTTVHQDVTAKGRLAAESLIDVIDHNRNGTQATVRQVLLPTELIVRDSTAPPPSPAD